MAMDLELEECKREREEVVMEQDKYMKGVRHLFESGITKVPNKYILPLPDRPQVAPQGRKAGGGGRHLKLPLIDLRQLRTGDRQQVLQTLDKACREHGFFQVVNHYLEADDIQRTIDVGRRFFELPFAERAEFMSTDIRKPVRYGTSFNQIQDGVFYWRDFLKLSCNTSPDSVLPHWPSSPLDLREVIIAYNKQIKSLFLSLMEALLDALNVSNKENILMNELENGSHLMVINYYPACPQPDLTLGMPPHSDYGFLTLLLQDDVEGLQLQCDGEWITVEPIPNSFVVNIGDHLEIFSNGRYKSALHRVMVNSSKSRISVASLHSLPYEMVVCPAAELVNEDNPRRYKDTDFAAFLDFISSHELKGKNFLDSRKLT